MTRKAAPFGRYAAHMLRGGYAPIPIRTGSKRPLFDEWRTPLTAAEIEGLARTMPHLGIGVMGGHNGLVPIDVDSDDEALKKAVASALPRPVVMRRGRKGYVGYWRASGGDIQACKYRLPPPPGKKVGPPIVEILTTGQTVIPPTLHKDTGQPYTWETRRTLYTVPVCNLSAITPADIERLTAALTPWCPPTRAQPPRPTVQPPAEVRADKRMRAYALAHLGRHARWLAGMAPDSGRNDYLFRAVCGVGKYVAHGVLHRGEVETALFGACAANRLWQDDGSAQCRATLAQGLKQSAHDGLPVLGYWGRSDGR